MTDQNKPANIPAHIVEMELGKPLLPCGPDCEALAAASSAQSMAMDAQAKVAVLEAELAGFRAEVQAMIDAATATDKARLWNMACFRTGREDLQVSVLNFADDAFKVAFVTAVGAEGMQALGAPLTIGETPKAPWS